MPRQDRTPGVVVLGSDFKALGVLRSLGQRGIPGVVIDNTPRSAWFSRYVTRRFAWKGEMEGDAFVDFLLRIAQTQQLENWLLFPAQDDTVELVAYNTVRLAQAYRLVTQDAQVLQWALDKRMTYRMAEAVGVPCPKTWYPRDEDDLRSMELPFPVIIKPARSIQFQHATRLKALTVGSSEELYAQYHRLADMLPADPLMVQEIIPGYGHAQYSVATYCKDGEVLCSMTARRTRQYPIDYGLGSSFVEAIAMPGLIAYAERLLDYMKVTGMVEVEFKHDERSGEYKLLDINVRPWGWHTLCMACGLDFPYMQYCDTLGQRPASVAPHYGYHWVRMLTDIPASIQEWRAGITPFRAYLRSFKGKTVFSVLDWRDPLPTAGDLLMACVRATSMLWKKWRRSVNSKLSTPQGETGQRITQEAVL